MGKPLDFFHKYRQRLLQMGLGLGLVALALIIEMVAVPPRGVHVYGAGTNGYKGMVPGMDRMEALEAVNRFKAVRQLETCNPTARMALSSRKVFDMTPELALAPSWICRPRKAAPVHLVFRKDRLAQVIVLRTGWKPGAPSHLLPHCLELNPDGLWGGGEYGNYPLYFHPEAIE